MTAADRKRLAVLRDLHNVFSDRLYKSSSISRAVHSEVEWLVTRGFAERYTDEDREHRVRITDAGRAQADVWEAAG